MFQTSLKIMWFTRKTLPPNLKNSVAPGKQTIFILLPWSVQKEAWSPHLLTSLAFSRARRHRVSAAQRHYWGPDFSLAALVLSSRAATSPCSKAAAVTSSWTAAVPYSCAAAIRWAWVVAVICLRAAAASCFPGSSLPATGLRFHLSVLMSGRRCYIMVSIPRFLDPALFGLPALFLPPDRPGAVPWGGCAVIILCLANLLPLSQWPSPSLSLCVWWLCVWRQVCWSQSRATPAAPHHHHQAFYKYPALPLSPCQIVASAPSPTPGYSPSSRQSCSSSGFSLFPISSPNLSPMFTAYSFWC